MKNRWKNYRKAHLNNLGVRKNELEKIISLINPRKEDIVLEIGTGSGFLTIPLAKLCTHVFTADINNGNLNEIKRKTTKLPIKTILIKPKEKNFFSKIYFNKFDKVATLATLHHFDNKKDDSGESGRIKLLKETYNLLKPNGKLVIADVLHNTNTQKYFNALDNPLFCYPNGHPHDFFSKERLQKILKNIGFSEVKIEVLNMPWNFKNIDEAKNFIHLLHNANCAKQKSLELAKKILGLNKTNGYFQLNWQLFFLTATKK
ncbi:MAG: protein-L-isoaspartate(D-aspartate) O-methyltransferase [Parcubacteria group bacterium Athens0714_25]|nr:MAG: protein-L-isoaspartate(D-aspartate) O-methyltransferase [Parcubacteria group bacterium Athens0714_25]